MFFIVSKCLVPVPKQMEKTLVSMRPCIELFTAF